MQVKFFDRSISLRLRRLTAENVCPFIMVVRIDDGVLTEEYAVSSTTLLNWWDASLPLFLHLFPHYGTTDTGIFVVRRLERAMINITQ